jgi:hypothetical protein
LTIALTFPEIFASKTRGIGCFVVKLDFDIEYYENGRSYADVLARAFVEADESFQ